MSLSEICKWFDGKHTFAEIMDEDYTVDRPIPKAHHSVVRKAVARAV